MKVQEEQQEELRRKIKWLMALRVVIVTVLLGTSILLQIRHDTPPLSIGFSSFLIATTYFLTIIYSLLLYRVRRLRLFSSIQLGMDLILLTSLVGFTGGIESPFSPFYMITILSASVLLGRKSGVLMASMTGILFGVVVDLQFLGITPWPSVTTSSGFETLYWLFLNVVAFLTVAYLAGSLTEKLSQTRQHLIEKSAGLADLQVFHENVIQSISSGVLTTDDEGRVTSLNQAAQKIIGYTVEEVKGRLWWQIFDAQNLDGLITRDNPLKESFRLNHECRRKDGGPLYLGMTGSPLRDGAGRVSGCVWAFQDLTRIREMEEEMKRKKWLAAIGEMSAGIAHEIRNPLASISGAMQVLKGANFPQKENRELMQIALKETERLNSIVTSFLVYACPSKVNRKRCDLHEILNETILFLKNSKEFRDNVVIKTNYGSGNSNMSVDRNQIKQVFLNLVLNAVQSMPEGGRLTVTTQRINPKRRTDRTEVRRYSWIRIGFKDSGQGISQENLEKIFYPFFTTKDRGSGLGLSIVHRIIEDHGGRIHVQSQVGSGTTIGVFLPMMDDGAVPIRKEEVSVQNSSR